MTSLLALVLVAAPQLPVLPPGSARSDARCLDAEKTTCSDELRSVKWNELGLVTSASFAFPDAGLAESRARAEAFVLEHARAFGVVDAGFEHPSASTSELTQQVAGVTVARLSLSAAPGGAQVNGHLWPMTWRLATSPAALRQTYDGQVFRCLGTPADECSLTSSGICDGRGCERPPPTANVTWRVPPPEVFIARRDCVDGSKHAHPARASLVPVACVVMPAAALALVKGTLAKTSLVDLTTGAVLQRGCEHVRHRVLCPTLVTSPDDIWQQVVTGGW